MTHRIVLTDIAQPMFIRANKYIMEKYRHEFVGLQGGAEQGRLLRELWYKEYSAKIIGNWEAVEFEEDKKFTLYLIKWG